MGCSARATHKSNGHLCARLYRRTTSRLIKAILLYITYPAYKYAVKPLLLLYSRINLATVPNPMARVPTVGVHTSVCCPLFLPKKHRRSNHISGEHANRRL